MQRNHAAGQTAGNAAAHASVSGVSVPDGIGGGGGGSRLEVLLGAGFGVLVGTSFIPNSLDSLERVLGREDPRDALGDSVFRVLEL